MSVTYTADGTQTVFSFPFDYLRKAFVFVEADGTALEQGTDFSVSGKTVVFATAPTAGTKLRIFRETETIPLVSWADASVLKAKDMTIQQVQVLHILEEYKGQYNEDLANMLIIAGIVTDSGELQHIVDQLNLIDSNTALVVDAVGEVNQAKEDAQASATSASDSALSATNSASSASDSATQAENLYEALIAQGGHPFQAATIADMTDTTKIYVYVGNESGYTNGNWYYYDGTAWVSGGVYNAIAFDTDKTLTANGAAADAKVTGQIRTNVGITVPTLTLTHGYYVYKDGNLAGGGTQNYDYSAPVPVTKGQRVEIVAAGYNTIVSMISTCASDGTNIVPKVISIDSSVHTYEYYVAEDGYVMFSFHTPEGYDVSIFDTDSNIVLDKRVSLNEYEITHELSVPIIDANTFEQGNWSSGSKTNSNFVIRFKDGYHVTNPSKITVVPNGQYTLVSAWYTRTEADGVPSFSDRAIAQDSWSDQPKEIYLPANCYVLVVVRKTYPTNTNTKPKDNLVQVYVADNQIFKNRADIFDLDNRVSALEEEVPSYWQTEIERVKTAINTNRLTIGNRIAEFFFITDLHWRLNAQKSILLMDALKKYSGIKTLLVGGDVVCTHTESQITSIEEIREFYQYLNDYRTISTMGNHDFNSNNNSSHPEAHITANQFYSACMSNEELFTNTNASPYVTIYDNESQKVRFIQFYHPDTISIPTNVQTEVINAIQEKGTDWTTFLMCHVYWAGGSVDQYITAFTQQLAELNASGLYSKIGALIVGHMHDDKDIVVDNNLLVIGSNCDIYAQTQGQETMTRGTDTEQSFDVFQVDLVNHKIYITRVGAGNDRQFDY